jgi:chromosome segregation ATPase
MEESAKQAAEAGKEEAKNEQKMGELRLSAWKANQALQDSARRISDQQKIAEETTAAKMEFEVKSRAFAREIAALDKSGKDYQNQLKALQDKEKQLTQEHENELTQIQEKAQEARNARMLSAEQRRNDAIAQGVTNVLMRHQSFSQMITSLGDQVASGMIQNAVKSVLADEMTKNVMPPLPPGVCT